MSTLSRTFTAAVLAAAVATPALAAPDASVTFSGGSVAFLAGVNWGSGTLTYRGHRYSIQVRGLSVGAIGANKYQGAGTVFHLRRLSDIEGTYGAVDASATAGNGGMGEIDMKNGAGVEIRAQSSSSGLKLALAPTGVEIKLKR